MALPWDKLLQNMPEGGYMMGALNNVNAFNKHRLENKYAPLETAIKAQNALAYSGRMGGINTFLRSISELPVKERQAYLANPENRKNYMTMIEQFRTGNNNPVNQVVTPALLQEAGFGNNAQQENKNPFSGMLMKLLGGAQNDNSLNQSQPQMQSQGMPQQQEPMPDPSQKGAEFGEVNKVSDEEANRILDERSNESAAKTDTVEPIVPQGDEGLINSPKLSAKDRDLLNSQLMTNNNSVSTTIKNRADNAIAFEGFLQKSRPQIAKAFNDAFKYNALYGRGKNWLDKFKTNQPEEYQNYILARDSLTPLIGNGIRFLENMGISHEAQEETKKMVSAINKLDTSPETAKKTFNENMKALYNLSEGVLDAAEPAHPGVRRKLSGVPHFSGEYIKPSKESMKISAGAKSLAKNLELPSFKNAEEFKSWYKKQPKVTQDAVKYHLGER